MIPPSMTSNIVKYGGQDRAARLTKSRQFKVLTYEANLWNDIFYKKEKYNSFSISFINAGGEEAHLV